MHRPATIITTIALALATVSGAAGCSDDDAPASAPYESPEGGANALPPTFAPFGELDGSTRSVRLDLVLVIVDAPLDSDRWTVELSDPAIATFTPGYATETAEFNPSFNPTAPGSTTVTITAPGWPAPIVFDLEVEDPS